MSRKGWSWVPTLYFAEGLPYVLVMTVSVIMFKNMGMSNTDSAFYTSWLYLPWVIKPIWSPLVDLSGTKRIWIITMQVLIGAGLAGVGLTINTDNWVRGSLVFLWLMAFASATHDISADGFYMLGLKEDEQSFFVGIRNTFYRIAVIFAQGVMVMAAGILSKRSGNVALSWSLTFYTAAGLMIAISLYHAFILPKPQEDEKRRMSLSGIADLFKTFFSQKDILLTMAFIMLYRLGEAQLTKITSPFMLDRIEDGGLGLATEQVGLAYGTIGVVFLLLGGIIGGIAVSRDGLKRWLWPMVIMMNVPNLLYVFLAYIQPENYPVIITSVSIEQFGYGFGFTAFTLYLIRVSQGAYKTAHYSICTGFMALGMMLPGMWSGALEEAIGYRLFFIWVFVCTIPGFILTAMIKKRL